MVSEDMKVEEARKRYNELLMNNSNSEGGDKGNQ